MEIWSLFWSENLALSSFHVFQCFEVSFVLVTGINVLTLGQRLIDKLSKYKVPCTVKSDTRKVFSLIVPYLQSALWLCLVCHQQDQSQSALPPFWTNVLGLNVLMKHTISLAMYCGVESITENLMSFVFI